MEIQSEGHKSTMNMDTNNPVVISVETSLD